MLKIIGGVFKYSCLVVLVLVLSHIIEIKGVTISQHVANSLNWLGEFNPKKISREISGQFQGRFNMINAIDGAEHVKEQSDARVERINSRIDAEVSPEDEQQLHQVIRNSRHR